MSGLDPNRLFRRALPWAIFLAAAQLLSAGVIYQFPLPTTNLNQAAGAARTNASVVAVPDIAGDDFLLSNSVSYVVDSLTVWSIANSPTSGPINTLGQEFSSFTLYTGYTPDGLGATWTQVNSYSLNSTQLNAAPRAYYTGTTDYQTLNPASGAYYPMYAVTFSGLNWSIPAGQVSYYGVGGVPIGSNTLALSASLYTSDPQYDPFLILTGNPWTPTSQGGADSISGFKGLAALNVSINGAAVPEPSTLGFLGLGIAALALKLRRRQ
jgi:hypothetical protein